MLENYRDRYRVELFESVVPFWLKHSLDHDFGGYFSCLDREGGVYDTRKYVWLQGRTVWVFSKLYNEVERKREWLEAARTGAEFLRRNALDPGGRCYFSLTREGRPEGVQRKPYSAVFVMMGMLEYAKATGEKSWREQAVDLFWKIRAWIEYPGMLGRPRLEGEAPASKLADTMVVAMMALELYEATGDRRYNRAMFDCLEAASRHWEPERRILLESAAPDGEKRLDSPDGRFFNPGHSIETACFLLRILRRHPNAERRKQVLDILEGSLEFGWDSEFGGLYYFTDIQGKPMLPLEAEMKLWWPHTEAIHAVILAYRLTREKKWLEWLERLDQYVFSHFPDQDYGEWFGYCDRHGNITNTCKGNNYKGMYHLARFLLMSIQEIEKLGAGNVPAG